MSDHNLHVIQVLGDNILLILGGTVSWTLAFLGVEPSHLGFIFSGDAWVIADWVFSHSAILLSCSVSIATLYKIRRDIKKQDAKEN